MSSNNWWAQKLGGQPQPQQSAPPAQPPVYVPPVPPAAPPPDLNPPRPPGGANPQGRCPSCGSGNYVATGSIMSQSGSVASMRCYDCGYPITQSGTGIGGVAASGPTQKAHQIPTGGWNPGTIIGHI